MISLMTSHVTEQVIFCVGQNHRTAGIATREEFFLNPEQIETAIHKTRDHYNLSELIVLSTCNRCEIFGVQRSDHVMPHDFYFQLFSAFHNFAGKGRHVDAKQIKSTLFAVTGQEAIRHAFLVAASLDSLVPGETQIIGQFKDAVAIAKNARSLGPFLSRLTQEALATTKKIRTQTDIGRHKISISHAAIDLARRASSDLSKLNFLVVGAGDMARVAAEYAASYKPKSLMIANRSLDNAIELTKHLGCGEPFSLADLHLVIARADVVISATSAPGHVIHKADVQLAEKKRHDGPLFLIDIALPRDIDPDVAALNDVYLFDIDDLKSVVDSHMEKRKESMTAAMDFVNDGVAGFLNWTVHHEVSPTIAGASQYMTDILSKEASKTFGKDVFSNLTPKHQEAIQNMLDAVASRVTGDVAQVLRESAPDDIRALAAALDLIFKKYT